VLQLDVCDRPDSVDERHAPSGRALSVPVVAYFPTLPPLQICNCRRELRTTTARLSAKASHMDRAVALIIALAAVSASAFAPPPPRVARPTARLARPTAQKAPRDVGVSFAPRSDIAGGPRDVAAHYYNRGGFPPPRPPGGGGGPGIGALVSLGLLFAFPGFFFNVLNTFFLGALILPPLAGFAFNFWAFCAARNFLDARRGGQRTARPSSPHSRERNIVQAPCPRCGAVAAGMKQQRMTQCMQCGVALTLEKDDESWRLRSKYEDEPGPTSSSSSSAGGGVIDVDSEVIDV